MGLMKGSRTNAIFFKKIIICYIDPNLTDKQKMDQLLVLYFRCEHFVINDLNFVYQNIWGFCIAASGPALGNKVTSFVLCYFWKIITRTFLIDSRS